MKFVLWSVSSVLLTFACYMSVMNWAVFVNNHILKKKWTSAVPLVGGIAGVLALICIPIEGIWKYAWVPLLLDWGSIPVILASLLLVKARRVK